MNSEKHNLLEDASKLEKEIKELSQRAKIIGRLADLKIEKLCIGKLVSGIEEILGLKADDADPFTIIGRLVAIKQELADHGKSHGKEHKGWHERHSVEQIADWINGAFKSYTVNNVNEIGHRSTFELWGRLEEGLEKMANIIWKMGISALEDAENYPQPATFTEKVAWHSGVNMARFVSAGDCANPVKSLHCAKKSLLEAVAYVCPTFESFRIMQEIVCEHYPDQPRDKGGNVIYCGGGS